MSTGQRENRRKEGKKTRRGEKNSRKRKNGERNTKKRGKNPPPSKREIRDNPKSRRGRPWMRGRLAKHKRNQRRGQERKPSREGQEKCVCNETQGLTASRGIYEVSRSTRGTEKAKKKNRRGVPVVQERNDRLEGEKGVLIPKDKQIKKEGVFE